MESIRDECKMVLRPKSKLVEAKRRPETKAALRELKVFTKKEYHKARSDLHGLVNAASTSTPAADGYSMTPREKLRELRSRWNEA